MGTLIALFISLATISYTSDASSLQATECDCQTQQGGNVVSDDWNGNVVSDDWNGN